MPNQPAKDPTGTHVSPRYVFAPAAVSETRCLSQVCFVFVFVFVFLVVRQQNSTAGRLTRTLGHAPRPNQAALLCSFGWRPDTHYKNTNTSTKYTCDTGHTTGVSPRTGTGRMDTDTDFSAEKSEIIAAAAYWTADATSRRQAVAVAHTDTSGSSGVRRNVRCPPHPRRFVSTPSSCSHSASWPSRGSDAFTGGRRCRCPPTKTE